MSRFITLILYLQAMVSNLLVPCVVDTANWKHCFQDHDIWLWPEIQRAWDLYTGAESPYAREADILNQSPKH